MTVTLLLSLGLVGAPLADARAAVARGDLAGWARARAARLRAGGRVDRGPWGRLEDLARLLRCRELDALDTAAETSEDAAARALLRLEAERLRRYVYEDAHRGTTVPTLFAIGRRLASAETTDGPWVRWPLEVERWPDEKPDLRMEPSRCVRPDAVDEAGRRARRASERAALVRATRWLEALPPGARGRVAFAYLEAASGTEGLPEAFLRRLLAVAEVGRSGYDDRVALAAASALSGPEAQGILRELLERAEAPGAARAAGLRWLERVARAGDPGPILGAARRVRRLGLDPTTGSWVDLVEARALVARGDAEAIDRFARAFAARDRRDATADLIWDLLFEAQLDRGPEEALSAVAGYGARRPVEVRARWIRLGRWALAEGALALARAVFDRLWSEATSDPSVPAPPDLPRLLADRARVALLASDPAAFEALVDQLVDPGLGDRGRARALFALVQDASARLADEPSGPLRARFAARLLGALAELEARGARIDPRLEAARGLLGRWAGRPARGRLGERPSRVRGPIRTLPLGRVELPRPRPLPPPPRTRLPPLRVDSFLVWTDADGVSRVGLPPALSRLAEAAPPGASDPGS